MDQSQPNRGGRTALLKKGPGRERFKKAGLYGDDVLIYRTAPAASRLQPASAAWISMAKTITLNASPAWPGVKNDFILSYEGHAIGRIRQAETAWEWHIIVPMAMPAWADGRADNF